MILTDETAVSLLTLTVKNCSGSELSATIDSMLEAWARIRHLRAVKRDILGWARTLEITAGINGYHPHIHILLLSRKAASAARRADYWASAWREAARLPYAPIIDIRDADGQGAVAEISKYITKVSALLEDVDAHHQELTIIADAIFKRRLRSFGGIWAKARRDARMIDVEDMDDSTLTATGELIDRPCSCGAKLINIILSWAGTSYSVKEDT